MTITSNDLFAHLDQQIDVMARVLASLNAEREALIGRDADALENALAEKNECLRRAAELERERQCMPSIDAGIDLGGRWDELIDLTRQCRAQNLHNGALIRGQRRRVEDTLQWLRGDSDAARVYGPDGERRSGMQSRATLASA